LILAVVGFMTNNSYIFNIQWNTDPTFLNVFDIFFAGERQKSRQKRIDLALHSSGLKPGAIDIFPLWLTVSTYFNFISILFQPYFYNHQLQMLAKNT
jgi:hypothetical protein